MNYEDKITDTQNKDAYDEIQQMVNATTSDRETIVTLTKTNEKLAREIVDVNKKLDNALDKLVKVK